MKLCTLCHRLLQKKRWLILILALAATLPLALLLPTWLWLAILSVELLVLSMLLIYLRDLHLVWNGSHVRMPAPRDALAEIVMIDASLVDTGACLQSAAQPVKPAAEMTLRLGKGTLPLGTAMVFLAERLPSNDANAILSAAAQLNLRVHALQERSPILRSGTQGGLEFVTVQDGSQERTYFMGDEKTAAAACSSIWEDHVRPMTPHDRERIHESALLMGTGNRRVYAYATAKGDDPPIFLGLAAVGDGLEASALEEMSVLRSMGMTLILHDDGIHPMDVKGLRRSLDIPDLHARPDLHLCVADPYPDTHCLSILRREERSLLHPVEQLRNHFSRMALMLERLFALMGLCLLCCVLSGGELSAAAVTAILAAAYLSFGSLTAARPVRRLDGALLALACLLIRLLLNTAVPGTSGPAGTCLCIALTALLSLTLAPRTAPLTLMKLLPMIIAALVCLLVQVLLVLPVLLPALLPMGFGLICGLLSGAVLLFLQR